MRDPNEQDVWGEDRRKGMVEERAHVEASRPVSDEALAQQGQTTRVLCCLGGLIEVWPAAATFTEQKHPAADAAIYGSQCLAI